MIGPTAKNNMDLEFTEMWVLTNKPPGARGDGESTDARPSTARSRASLMP